MRLIDADKAIEDIKERWSEFFCPECGYEVAVQFIEEQETIDPIIHAEWKEDGCLYKCSNCGMTNSYYSDSYCVCCGAKMDKDE